MGRDPNTNARDLREQRMPVVSECRLKHKMTFRQIIVAVADQTKQTVTVATIKHDWDYLVKQWRTEAARNTKDACDEALMQCETVIAELWLLYENSKRTRKVKTARVKSLMTDIDAFGNPVISQPLPSPVPTETESASRTEEVIGDVKILAEIRKWEERRDKLLGLDKVNIDITSGGQKFTGFSSVLPMVPNIEDIVRRIDEERERAERENDD